MNLKKRIYNILLTEEIDDPLERSINAFLICVILLSIVSVILETEQSLSTQFSTYFYGFEVFTVAIFTIEYILRLWVCTMDPRYKHPILGRMRYALTPIVIIDLISVVPFYIPSSGLDLRFVRAIRLFRLFRLLKLGRYSASLRTLGRVLKAKKEELLITLFAGLIVLIIASSIMYYVERETQPEAFSSIPNSMWWGVATLTTIGYGDIYPKTALGKLLGSFIALLGIGLFALPAGIIASGFSSELQNKTKEEIVCPHCGEVIEK